MPDEQSISEMFKGFIDATALHDATKKGKPPDLLEQAGGGVALLDTVLGVSLSKTWLGITRQCTDAEKVVMLRDDLVEGDKAVDVRMLRISKQLINSKHPSYRKLSKAASKVRGQWSSSTTPWVKPGVRILKKSNYQDFVKGHAARLEDFTQARADFCAAWPDVVEEAKSRLGDLFDAALYPASLPASTFEYLLDWPSLVGDASIEALDPAAYQKMKEAATLRLEQACGAAEKAFAAQLQEIIARVVHALTPGVDGAGKKVVKRLGQTQLDAFKSFYETFKTLKVQGHDDLDALCQKALKMAEGVDLASAKDCADVAAGVAQQFKGLADNVAVATGVKAPVRKISSKKAEGLQKVEEVAA